MKMKGIAIGAAALAAAMAPIGATAVSAQRESAPVSSEASELQAGSGALIGLAAIIAIIGIIVVSAGKKDPVSA